MTGAAPYPDRIELLRRSDGPRYRRVTLIVERSGALALNVHEMGATLEAAWGADDEEVTLSVSPDEVGRLALALAAEVLKGGADAVARLGDICDSNDVPCRIACWT
jgi:hypothetical protein